jgi:hypothetical protein
MTEISIGNGFGFVVESGLIVDQSGGCPDTPKELLSVKFENKATYRRKQLY